MPKPTPQPKTPNDRDFELNDATHCVRLLHLLDESINRDKPLLITPRMASDAWAMFGGPYYERMKTLYYEEMEA